MLMIFVQFAVRGARGSVVVDVGSCAKKHSNEHSRRGIKENEKLQTAKVFYI